MTPTWHSPLASIKHQIHQNLRPLSVSLEARRNLPVLVRATQGISVTLWARAGTRTLMHSVNLKSRLNRRMDKAVSHPWTCNNWVRVYHNGTLSILHQFCPLIIFRLLWFMPTSPGKMNTCSICGPDLLTTIGVLLKLGNKIEVRAKMLLVPRNQSKIKDLPKDRSKAKLLRRLTIQAWWRGRTSQVSLSTRQSTRTWKHSRQCWTRGVRKSRTAPLTRRGTRPTAYPCSSTMRASQSHSQ